MDSRASREQREKGQRQQRFGVEISGVETLGNKCSGPGTAPKHGLSDMVEVQGRRRGRDPSGS